MCAAADARHRGVRASLAAVSELLPTIAGDGPPAPELLARFEDLAVFLERHCTREEQLLWPAFAALAEAARRQQPRPPLPFPTMLHPVRLMESEHTQLRARLDHLRDLTVELALPVDAVDRWRKVRDGLATLTAAVADHERYEDEVLYPEALEVERRLG